MGQFRNYNDDDGNGDIGHLVVLVVCFGLIGGLLIAMQVMMIKSMVFIR